MHLQTITELAPRLRDGQLSPVDLTQAMLQRIAALDGRLKSYATVTAELALQQAMRATSLEAITSGIPSKRVQSDTACTQCR